METFLNRNYGLDIIRALAILSVLAVHSADRLPVWARNIYFVLFYFDGVFVFFVLSGFLIGRILIKTLENSKGSQHGIFTFWTRRWLRTLPLYYVILIILISINYLKNSNVTSDIELWQYLFFIQNLFDNHPDFFGEAWSLSVEEWFYLTIPLLLFICVFKFKVPVIKIIPILTVFVIALTIALKLYKINQFGSLTNFPAYDTNIRKQVFTSLDMLIFGVLGAFVNIYYSHFWAKRKKLNFALGLLLILFAKFQFWIIGFNSFTLLTQQSFTGIGVLLTLPFFYSIKSGVGIMYRFLTFTSIVSYSLYLVHSSFINWFLIPRLNLRNFIQNPVFAKGIEYILFWLFSFTIAYLMYRLIEKPFMKLRDNEKLITFTTHIDQFIKRIVS